MKSKNLTYTILFSIIFIVLFCLASLVFKMNISYQEYMYATPLLLIFITYRYGFNYAIVGHVMSSLIISFIEFFAYKSDLVQTLLVYVCYALAISIPGLFAKNIHRTLNNKRYKSVFLNIITSIVIATFIIWVTNYVLNIDSYKIAVQFFVINIIYCLVMARLFPQLILTKRSAYLSSKERSKLLND